MASVRDQLLRDAQQRGAPFFSQIKGRLDATSPAMLWCEVARCHLENHGFVTDPNESFAVMFARALNIDTEELRAYLTDNRLGKELLQKFPPIEIASDNTSHQDPS